MAEKQKLKEGDLVYFLTLYKLEGHQTWRAHFSGRKNGFELEQKNCSQQPGKTPKITEKNELIIDRLTGTFKQ